MASVAATVGPGGLVGLAAVPRAGAGLASGTATWAVAGPDLRAVVDGLEQALGPRWVWWRARTTAPPLLAEGLRLRRCWDLGAVSLLLRGGSRDDPAAVWAGVAGLPTPPPPRDGGGDLLDLLADPDDGDGEPVGPDGHLRPGWARERWEAREQGDQAGALALATRWAALASTVQARQERELGLLPDPRGAGAPGPPLPLLTAHAESAAALLAAELEADGLPLDRATAQRLVTAAAGPRPATPAEQERAQANRDATVLRHLPDGLPVDLRNPASVRDALRALGIDVPDTRSWRLARYRGSHPAVDALLAWRKAERVATTYGWSWLDRQVGADGRLRGAWSATDGAGGRMTAQAGLHNLPAELRPAVAAEPGHVLVRADLGQVEPRVLAVVSGDAALAAATRADDLYAPVADRLRCDRATAKVAVLAAMYGQTSGTAGAALRQLDAVYPRAMGYLRSAEAAGLAGRDVRTHGGRLLRLAGGAPSPGRGRFARNAVVQGAAAELFKAWAATVRAGLLRMDEERASPVGGGRVVLCLHDELLLHVPAERAEEAAALLDAALAATAARWAWGSGVRFVADVRILTRWSEAKG